MFFFAHWPAASKGLTPQHEPVEAYTPLSDEPLVGWSFFDIVRSSALGSKRRRREPIETRAMAEKAHHNVPSNHLLTFHFYGLMQDLMASPVPGAEAFHIARSLLQWSLSNKTHWQVSKAAGQAGFFLIFVWFLQSETAGSGEESIRQCCTWGGLCSFKYALGIFSSLARPREWSRTVIAIV